MGSRFVIKTLVIGDSELNCDCKDKTLDDINITNIGFSDLIVNQYDLIIYEGTKGTKILKSTKTKTGKVV